MTREEADKIRQQQYADAHVLLSSARQTFNAEYNKFVEACAHADLEYKDAIEAIERGVE